MQFYIRMCRPWQYCDIASLKQWIGGSIAGEACCVLPSSTSMAGIINSWCSQQILATHEYKAWPPY